MDDRLLTQPAYAGYICNKNTDFEMYEGQHFKEAIISLETFEQVQRVISSQNRKRLGTLRNAVTAMERSIAMRRWNKGEISDSDKNELIISLEVEPVKAVTLTRLPEAEN